MAGWMSPKELNEDPKRWLDIPHELHVSLLSLQEKMFPGFKQKLVEQRIHCLECDGKKPFEVLHITTGKPGMCVGYIAKEDGTADMLCMKEIKDAQKVQ